MTYVFKTCNFYTVRSSESKKSRHFNLPPPKKNPPKKTKKTPRIWNNMFPTTLRGHLRKLYLINSEFCPVWPSNKAKYLLYWLPNARFPPPRELDLLLKEKEDTCGGTPSKRKHITYSGYCNGILMHHFWLKKEPKQYIWSETLECYICLKH